MNYSEVFSRAWAYVRRHKILWLFGLLAGSAMMGAPDRGFQYRFGSHDMNFPNWTFPHAWGNQMRQFFEQGPGWTWVLFAAGVVALVTLLVVIRLFASTFGRAGVIQGAVLAEAEGTTERLKFKQIYQGFKPHFWKLVLLRMLTWVAGFLVALIVALPLILFTIGTLGLGLLCLVPFLILLIPVMLVVQAFLNNISIAVIDESLKLMDAVSRAWQVTLDNFGHMLAVTLLLGIIRLVVMLVMMLPLILVAMPVMLAYSAKAAQWQTAGIVIAIVLGVLWILGMALVFAIASAFEVTTQTLTFRALKNARKPKAAVTQAIQVTPLNPAPEDIQTNAPNAEQHTTD